MVRCTSLSVFLEQVKVVRTTDSGDSLIERLFGTVGVDNVVLVGIANGIDLTYPPGGRKVWPDDEQDWALREGGARPPTRLRLATVEPFGSGCEVKLNLLVRFYERDWDNMQALLDAAVKKAVSVGMLSVPPAYSGFSAGIEADAIKVIKDVLDFFTGFQSEFMGDIPIVLPAHRLDDGAQLSSFPWGAELSRDKFQEEEQDSFKYKTMIENWGGKWEVILYFERVCTRPPEDE